MLINTGDSWKNKKALQLSVLKNLFVRPNSERCFTDGNGPDVFKKCAYKWVTPDNNATDDYGLLEDPDGNGQCSFRLPPSALDEVCLSFHKKIKELQ